MRSTLVRRLTWVWLGIVALLTAVPLLIGGYVKEGAIGTVGSLGWLLLPVLFTALGAVIVTKQPGNRISWILLVVGFAIMANTIADAAVAQTQGTPGLWENLALAVSDGGWILIMFPIFLLLFLFPSGRFLTPRWRWAGWLAASMVGFFLLFSLFVEEWGGPSGTTVTNPVGFIPRDLFEGLFGIVWVCGLLSLAFGGLVSLAVRYRRAEMMERTQLKWFLYATAVFAVGFALIAALEASAAADDLLSLFLTGSLAVLPVSITFAITRYKLFEIDRIISRTLSYTAVVGFLATLFFGMVTLVTALLPSQNSLAVAGATLAVAALFNPLRRRLQHAVDRHFNRSGYRAELVSEAFATRLREPLSSQEITGLWIQAVQDALQPRASGIWLKNA